MISQVVPSEFEIGGHVSSGRGWATDMVRQTEVEVSKIVRQQLCPGSLNLVFDAPLGLRADAAFVFDRGSKMLWRASLDGLEVWLYRWDGAPLHVAEVLSPIHLRTHFGLKDGDRVTLRISRQQVQSIGMIRRLAWAMLWLGREDRFYQGKAYYEFACHVIRYMWSVRHRAGMLKAAVKRTPVLSAVCRRALGVFRRPAKSRYQFSRLNTADATAPAQRTLRQIYNVLNYTKTSESNYSAENFAAGYHTLNILGQVIEGQRHPVKRLQLVPLDFRGKTVLDLGCNQGGMIHELRDSVKWAVGIDYDPRMINAANKIKDTLGAHHCCFYIHDLQRDPLDLISDFLPEETVDVCFLLAVCMWIDNWRDVIDFARRKSRSMVFETNGTPEQQDAQIAYLRECYTNVLVLSDSSDDDPLQKRRQLLYLTGAIASAGARRRVESIASGF